MNGKMIKKFSICVTVSVLTAGIGFALSANAAHHYNQRCQFNYNTCNAYNTQCVRNHEHNGYNCVNGYNGCNGYCNNHHSGQYYHH